MGGLFLYAESPPAKGSSIEVMVDVGKDGVRARAVVRHVTPGKGMGVQFIQMRAEDRARLNQFLELQQAKGAPAPSAASSARKSESKVSTAAPASPKTPPLAPKSPPAETQFNDFDLEAELKPLMELAVKGTYYQLLGVTSESSKKQIKESFYALARKFHPDHHMGSSSLASLQELMEVVTEAYKTLGNDQKKVIYDKRLAASGALNLERSKTESQETIDECLERATECLAARNFAGSIVWLRRCVLRAPDVAKYHALLGRSLASFPAYRDEAIEHFEAAIELDPWNATAYLHFAELYEEMKLPWRARPLYSKVLEIDSSHSVARERLEQIDSAAPKKRKESTPLVSRIFSKKR